MFLPKTKIESELDSEILTTLNAMNAIEDKSSEKYATYVDRLSKLHKLKSEEKTKLPSLDTVLVVAANIYGILRITRYERENVISSKSLGFIKRP